MDDGDADIHPSDVDGADLLIDEVLRDRRIDVGLQLSFGHVRRRTAAAGWTTITLGGNADSGRDEREHNDYCSFHKNTSNPAFAREPLDELRTIWDTTRHREIRSRCSAARRERRRRSAAPSGRSANLARSRADS